MVDIQVRTTDDLLDVIESMCGYTPDCTVTAIAAEQDAQPHILAMRITEEADIAPAVDALTADDVIGVVAWGEEDTAPLMSAVRAYAILYPDVPTFRATKTEWWWIDEPVRRPRRPSEARAHMIYHGVSAVVADNREAMFSSRLLYEPRWGELAHRYPPVEPKDGGRWVVNCLTEKEPLNREQTAQVLGAVTAGVVRDYVTEVMATYRLERRLPDLDNMRTRMVEVVAEAADGERHTLYRLIGIACHLLGNPEVAEAAQHLAHQDFPEEELTRAFDALFRQSPDHVAHVLLTACELTREEYDNE